MSFLNSDALKKVLSTDKRVDPYSDERIKSGAYELTLGKEFFTTNTETNTKTILDTGAQFTIEPGQFALLITEEYIKIPADKLGFISIKAKIKFEGLINVSGFHVDPGFEGKLKFSVYNAGSKPITLDIGQPLFPMWLADFNQALDAQDIYRGEHKKQDTISRDDVSKIAGVVTSPAVLDKKMTKLENELERKISALDSATRSTDTMVKAIGALLLSVGLFVSGITYKTYADSTDKEFQEEVETKQKLVNVKLAKLDSILSIQNSVNVSQDITLKKVQAAKEQTPKNPKTERNQ